MASATEGLDLSFVQIDNGKDKGVKQSDTLDMSFLEAQPASRAFDPLADEQADPQVLPTVQERETGFFQSVADFFTGKDRETKETQALPEFDVPAKFAVTRPGDTFKTALGMLFTFSPEDQAKVLKRNFPELTFERDEKGNIIVDATPIGGGRGVLNQPGVSGRDVIQTAGLMAAFTPAGRAAKVGGTIRANMARVGAASGVTQAGLDVAAQAAGREEDVSVGNIRLGDVTLATLGGAGAQALIQRLAPLLPVLRAKWRLLRRGGQGIDDEIRSTVKEHAVKLGLNADDITDDVIDDILKQVDEATSLDDALLSQGEREFGIGLTKGQRSLDQPQLSFEDRARAGIQGDKAQRIMTGFEAEQQQAAQAARTGIETRLAGGRQPIEGVVQAGGVVREGVQAAERAAKGAVDEAFGEVGDAALKPKAFKKLVSATKQAIEGLEFVTDETLAPATRSLTRKLDGIDKVLSQGKGLRPVHIRKLEEVRRAINAFEQAAANPADKRNIIAMRQAYDDFLDDAVKKALFTGDEGSLNALKSARSIFREYAKKFREQPQRTRGGRLLPDPEGKFIEKIIADNPTDVEIVNAVFGAGNFNKGSGAKMAQRFKAILGPDSPEWGAIRQAAFKKLIKTNTVNNKKIISGQNTLKAIDEAMEKNPELMRQLFSKDEMSLFRRFAQQVKRTQPDLVRSRENVSGTAQVLTKTVRDLLGRIGLFTGDPTLMVTSRGVEVARGFTSGSKAAQSVRPFSPVIQANPNIVGATTGATRAQFQNVFDGE